MSEKSCGNDSIKPMKGAEAVRRTPYIYFGSDGLEGCQRAADEILSNAVDEAREGYGNQITLTRFLDHSIQVEDYGRGCPVEWNEKEKEYNWKLIFCELVAGGEDDNGVDGKYDKSLGVTGLGACATQCASEYFDVVVYRDGFKYALHFEHGEIVGELQKKPTDQDDRTGTIIRWKPDPQVFTDIDIPPEYFLDVLKDLAVANEGVTFEFRNETADGVFETTSFCYKNGEPIA